MANANGETTRRRGPRSATRHDDIISAAARLFYMKGFEATTTQDIADEVGMLKGSLYYHVASKDALLVEVLAEIHEIFARNLEELAGLQGTPIEKIWALVFRNAEANARHHVRSAVFSTDFRSLDSVDAARIIELRDMHDRQLREFLTAGQEHGVVCREVDVKLTAIAVLSMCNAIHRWYRPGDGWSPDDIGRAFADFVVASLTCPGPDDCRHRAFDPASVVARLAKGVGPDDSKTATSATRKNGAKSRAPHGRR